jgi:hypothetical protein
LSIEDTEEDDKTSDFSRQKSQAVFSMMLKKIAV